MKRPQYTPPVCVACEHIILHSAEIVLCDACDQPVHRPSAAAYTRMFATTMMCSRRTRSGGSNFTCKDCYLDEG